MKDSSHNMAWPWLFPRRILLSNIFSSSSLPSLTTSPLRSSKFALYITNFHFNKLLVSFCYYSCGSLVSYRPPQQLFPLIKWARRRIPRILLKELDKKAPRRIQFTLMALKFKGISSPRLECLIKGK